MEAGEFVKWGLAVLGGAGVFPWIKMWFDGRARRSKADTKQRADLMEIAETAANNALSRLEAEIRRAHTRIAELEAELIEARKEHTEMLAAKEARLALLEGEIRHWMQIADSYERQLTEAGIPHTKPTQPIWRVAASMGVEPS